MQKQLLHKFGALILALSLVFSNTLNCAYAVDTPPEQPQSANQIIAEPIEHTEKGAEQVLDELMSISTKLLKEEFEELNPGMEFIKNVNISKSPDATKSAFGRFKGGQAKSATSNAQILNFDSGIVMTTGFVDEINKSTNSDNRTSGKHEQGNKRNDKNLANLIGVDDYRTLDTAFIEFDVYCPEDASDLMFEYALASEEYNEFLTYNDVFGVFLNDTNISTIPGTSEAISVSNINHLRNEQFYHNNRKDQDDRGDNYGTNAKFLDLPSEFDGFTSTFTASGKMIPNQYNHIKIAIADNKDQILDTALFLKSGTLQLKTPQYGTFNLMDWTDNDEITISRSEGIDGTVSVDLEVLTQSSNTFALDDGYGNKVNQLKVVFNSGDSQVTVKLPKSSTQAMMKNALPKTAIISNPKMGATLGAITRLDKDYEKALVTFGTWRDEDPDQEDSIQIHRSVNFKHTVAVDLEITSKYGVKSYKTVTFAPNETTKNISVPDVSKHIKLINGKATNIGKPDSIEKTPKFYGVIGIDSWDDQNKVTLVRNKGSEGTVSVSLTGKNLSGDAVKLDPANTNDQTQYKVEFLPGETQKTVQLMPNDTDALINGTAINRLKISAPKGGATLGKKEASKQFSMPVTSLSLWDNKSSTTDDVIEIKRTGSTKYASEVTLKLTSKTGANTQKTVRFNSNESNTTVSIPETTKLVLLTNGRGTTIAKPSKLEKVFENQPTGLKRLTFTVVENSEVHIQLRTANNNVLPRFNYKITKLSGGTKGVFSFYGDGRNVYNGMDDLYYMEPGTYAVDIYWLDKKQAETAEQIEKEISNTLFEYSIEPLGENVDKKKFYKKIN